MHVNACPMEFSNGVLLEEAWVHIRGFTVDYSNNLAK